MNTLYAAARAAAGANESTSRCQVHKNSFSKEVKPVTPNVILSGALRKGGKDHEDRLIVQGLSARAAFSRPPGRARRAGSRGLVCFWLVEQQNPRPKESASSGKAPPAGRGPAPGRAATRARAAAPRPPRKAPCAPAPPFPVKSNCAGSFCLQTSILDLHKKPAFKSTLKEKDIQW